MTVNLTDIIESTLVCDLTPNSISFKAKTGKYVNRLYLLSAYHRSASKGIEEKDYEFDLTFFGEVVPEVSTRMCHSSPSLISFFSYHPSVLIRVRSISSSVKRTKKRNTGLDLQRRKNQVLSKLILKSGWMKMNKKANPSMSMRIWTWEEW